MRRRALSEASQLELNYFDSGLEKKKGRLQLSGQGEFPLSRRRVLFLFFYWAIFCEVSPITCGGKKKDVQVSNQRLVVGNWSMQEDQTDNLQSGNERFEGKEELRSVEYVRSFKKIRDDLQPRSRFGQKGKDPW